MPGLLDQGRTDIRVFLTVALEDEVGNTSRGPSPTGLLLRNQLLVPAIGFENAADGQSAPPRYTLYSRGLLTVQNFDAYSEIELVSTGERLAVIAPPQWHTTIRSLAHVQAQLRER